MNIRVRITTKIHHPKLKCSEAMQRKINFSSVYTNPLIPKFPFCSKYNIFSQKRLRVSLELRRKFRAKYFILKPKLKATEFLLHLGTCDRAPCANWILRRHVIRMRFTFPAFRNAPNMSLHPKIHPAKNKYPRRILKLKSQN